MDLGALAQIGLIFVLCSVKFGLVGVPGAVLANWPFFKVMAVTISGGIAGVFFFTFLSERLILSYKKIKPGLIKGANQKSKPKRKFTITNKTIVWVKLRLGLIGLAFITPIIISIPLGVFLAVRYFKNRNLIWRYMILSIVFWAVALYFFYHHLYEGLRNHTI